MTEVQKSNPKGSEATNSTRIQAFAASCGVPESMVEAGPNGALRIVSASRTEHGQNYYFQQSDKSDES